MYGATTYVEAFTFAIVTQMTIGAHPAAPACLCYLCVLLGLLVASLAASKRIPDTSLD
jgi:hypothetical protein